MALDIPAALHQLVIHTLDQIGAPVAQGVHPPDHVDNQVEPVDVVQGPHVERHGDGALLLVAPDVEVLVVPVVGQLMDQRRIAVVGENNGLILCEQHVVLLIRQAVGMLGVGLELHQVHYVHHTDLQFRQFPPQDRDRRQGLQSGRVAAAGHDHIRLLVLVVGSPVPDADALGAVLHRLVHGQPLGTGVLGGHHDVHIVPALDAVVKAAQQAVGIGGQINAYHIRLLVVHMVQEAGILVSEAIVVLLPDVGGEDIVQGGDILPPGQLGAGLEPLGVLGEHGVHDADERLTAVEKSVAAGEQIALQHTLAHMLGQHGVHHAAVGVQMLVLGHLGARKRRPVTSNTGAGGWRPFRPVRRTGSSGTPGSASSHPGRSSPAPACPASPRRRGQ